MARQAVSENPQDGLAHAILAQALSHQKNVREAFREIQLAIQLSPAEPHVHYLHSIILFQRKQWKPAKEAIREAIRLYPENADYYGILSAFHFEDHDWKTALEIAEQGRAIEPENEQCINMMAAALIKLGRRDELAKVLGDALARNPENDEAHANQGWAALHAGQMEVTMLHFREALRLNPDNRSARNGILESLRARNPLYRIILRYFLWMSRMNTQARWGVILGGYVFIRVINSIGMTVPILAPFTFLLSIVYMLFAIFTWIARPMTDLLLRLDRNGRLLLSKSQIQSTNVGLLLVAVAVGLFLIGLINESPACFGGALGALALILPVFGSFQVQAGNKRNALLVYTLVLTFVGIGAFGQALSFWKAPFDLSNIFFLGWIAFSWIANIVASSR